MSPARRILGITSPTELGEYVIQRVNEVKCRNCQLDNPDDASFCTACGNSLSSIRWGMGCLIALLGFLVFWVAMLWGWNYDYEEGTLLFILQDILAGVSLLLLIGGPLFFWLLLPVWRRTRSRRIGAANHKVSLMKTCLSCGKTVVEESQFCPYCGRRLELPES